MPREVAALARRVVAPGRCPVPVVEVYSAGEVVFPAGEASPLAGKAAFPARLVKGPTGPLMPFGAAALARRLVAPGRCPVPVVGMYLT